MLVAAACCPQSPLLVPELATGQQAEVLELRAACEAALDALFAARPDLLVVIGSADDGDGLWPSRHAGSLAGFGRAIGVRLSDDPDEDGALPMPVSMLVAARLLAGRPPTPPRVARLIGAETPPERCAEFGAELVAGETRVGLLVMGDGCTYEGLGGPLRASDAPAAAFDAEVARALKSADAAALLALDPVDVDDPKITGLRPWAVLAGAALAGAALADTAPAGTAQAGAALAGPRTPTAPQTGTATADRRTDAAGNPPAAARDREQADAVANRTGAAADHTQTGTADAAGGRAAGAEGGHADVAGDRLAAGADRGPGDVGGGVGGDGGRGLGLVGVLHYGGNPYRVGYAVASWT